VVLKPFRHGQEVPVVSFNNCLERIKGDLAAAVPEERIRQLCQELEFVGRNRVLTPVVTTYLTLLRALHAAPMSALRRHSGFDVSPQAYCQAVARLPVAFFARLQQAVIDESVADQPGRSKHLWNGRRLFFIDGSSFSMPDTPALQAEFGQSGQQSPGCGFPTAHLLIQFAGATGFAVKTIVAPLRTHDMAHAAATHDALQNGDILVGDRAFGSFAHLALLRRRGLHGVFRAHQIRSVHRRPGPRERYVTYDKPKCKPAWLADAEHAALPEQIVVREVRVTIPKSGTRVKSLVLVTTLLDAVKYPAKMIADIYESRWAAETNLRHLKQTLGLDVLRSRSVEGVIKELHAFVIIYNLVRRVMCATARQQQVKPDRVSFVDALRWLRQAAPGDEVPELIVNPDRPGRHQPRVKKRRPKPYALMTRPRAELRKKLGIKRSAS
jgi:Transposase DDE domain